LSRNSGQVCLAIMECHPNNVLTLFRFPISTAILDVGWWFLGL